MEKLRADCKDLKQELVKKNQHVTVKYCEQVLDQIINQSIKPKHQQGLYQTIGDLDADLKFVSQEFMSVIYSQRGIKDSPIELKVLNEYLLLIGMKIGTDICNQVF